MKIAFLGDIFLGGDLLKMHTSKMVSIQDYHMADLRIGNLEHPISNRQEEAGKATLFTNTTVLRHIAEMRLNAVNLANNHIHDKLSEGIGETIGHLDEVKVGHFGAGVDARQAKEPFWIDGDICVLGYCEYGRPYLKKIQVASEQTAGVNPLRYETVTSDLDRLPTGKKAILFFHWGREHVWLPPYQDIALAKRLLEDDRVIMIVGTHCHRVQGYVHHNGKYAYMSIGNFLFPNFFIEPPTHLVYPDEIPTHYWVTRDYHKVSQVTYKMWRLINRISLVLVHDTSKHTTTLVPTYQNDDVPNVGELKGVSKTVFMGWISFLSWFYKLPKLIYTPLAFCNAFTQNCMWYGRILVFNLRQGGLIGAIQYVNNYISSR